MKKIEYFILTFGSLGCIIYFARDAGVAQLVERQPSKLNVAGSSPVSRSIFDYKLLRVTLKSFFYILL